MSFIDLIGSLLSLICTYLFIKENKHAWTLSAVAIPFDAFIYYQNQLFGDMFLQLIYLSMTLYGYQQWRGGKSNNDTLFVSRLSINQKIILSIICILGIACINPLLQPFNLTHIALLDSITTMLSLCAQWLLCKKKIETWLLWFCVDGLYIYLYTAKSLPFHGIMALIYLFMAINGWCQWRKSLLSEKPTLKTKEGKQKWLPSLPII